MSSKGRAFYVSYYVAKTSPPASKFYNSLRKGARWRRLPLSERFWSRVDKSEECWLWTGTLMPKGYGRLCVNGSQRLAHRVSYELTYGVIPEGYLVCHHCDNPRCVRPDHLFVGTNKDNLADMRAKGRHRSDVPKGERHYLAKFTNEDVIEIKRLRGIVPQRVLAKRYGVVKSTIANIHRGETWKGVAI